MWSDRLYLIRQHDSNLVGVGRRENFADRVRFFFTNFSDKYAHGEECVHACAKILDEAKDSWNETWRDRAAIAIAKYRCLEEQYANRKAFLPPPIPTLD